MFKEDLRVKQMLISRGLPFKPCGLNADWCVSAWHLSDGQPNTKSGDFYLLDTEERNEEGTDWEYEVVQRFYKAENSEDNDDVRVVHGPAQLETVVNRFTFKQKG